MYSLMTYVGNGEKRTQKKKVQISFQKRQRIMEVVSALGQV